MKLKAILASLFLSASFVQAEEVEIVVPDNVSEAEGLEAWARMYEVVSRPRCANCHVGEASDAPHTPPGVQGDWRLAPVEAAWFGKGSVEICTQLRNPDTNGGREPAPYSLQEHANDVLAWGAAGMPCPKE